MIGLFVGWFVFWFLVYLFFAILVGVYASKKGRSQIGWIFLSVIITPMVALIILLIVGPPSKLLKKCPTCAEEVKVEAVVCRFCNYKFTREEQLDIAKDKDFFGKKQGSALAGVICTVFSLVLICHSSVNVGPGTEAVAVVALLLGIYGIVNLIRSATKNWMR
jgi:hypothetical protein